MSVPTHEVTLYRLSDAAPDLDAFLETLPGTYLDEAGGGDFAFPDYRGATAVALHWRRNPVSVPWVKAATHLIGPLPDRYETLDCGALLLLDVDGDRYAIGFGSGFRAVPDQLKDHGFGLRFTIRAVDAEQVRSVVRRSMTGLGRQDSTRGEAVYNEWVQDSLGTARFLNLDRTSARTEFHGANGFEPCDLLGPDNELVHVKRGKGTEPFSHMFSQALISAESLVQRHDARTSFAELVDETSRGKRALPEGWRPAKVVLAMRVDRKAPLTPATLFPNAQIALAHLAQTLARYGIEVEVIVIPREEVPSAAA